MKSPVASLCLDCSSVRKRVRVTMSVLIFSCAKGTASLFVWAIIATGSQGRDGGRKWTTSGDWRSRCWQKCVLWKAKWCE